MALLHGMRTPEFQRAGGLQAQAQHPRERTFLPPAHPDSATVLGLNDVDKHKDLISRLQDEADLCRNDGASDIAALLDEATEALRVERVVLAELALKTGELIEHMQKTGRLKPCFYMPALADARNVLAN